MTRDGGESAHSRPDDGSASQRDESADRLMAELLEESTNAAELRRRLKQGGAMGGDLLGRVNALEFLGSVVGEGVDIPDQLGDYRIQGLLGRGGMGTVYEAFQEQLERVVALKVLGSTWSSDPTMRQRFRAEARATAALHHRHIVPIYDYGEAQGRLYFAMEKVDGVSLDRLIAGARRLGRPPLQPLDAARRFAGVADALGLAHRRRILHRDVKPGNILVSTDGTMALTDFGLAKVLDRASMRLTSKSGGFMGTLHYSSPEQALGRELTPASDLYSLGVTLFEALTGELPLRGRTTEAVLRSVLEERPRRLRECMHRPPRDLELVLDKLLSKEPRDRYQDGEELSRDLQRIADQEPVHIRRQSPLVVLWRRARKNPVLSGAIIATLVLLLSTVGLWRGLSREKGQSLVSRHQNHIAGIVADIKREVGAPWGPAGLLQGLVGVELPDWPPPADVLVALEQAQTELPDDPVPARMRTALLTDPLPAATELLRQGRGYEAMLQLNAAIESDLALRSGGEPSVELRLYRLYLARAVASLTASVGSRTSARMDLSLATFLRPGAGFPRLLTAVLDLLEAPSPAALERMRGDLADDAPERRLPLALLLRAIAAPAQVRASNLMSVTLPHDLRRAVAALADAWLGEAARSGGLKPAAPGLGDWLANTAREAMRSMGRTGSMQLLLAGARRSLESSAHPDAPLQSWRAVFHLLEHPTGLEPPVEGDGDPMAPAVVLAGWELLLGLEPPPELLTLLLPRFEVLRAEHGGLDGMVRIAAQVHHRAGGPDAELLAARWVAATPRDPDALRCRMASHLRAGRIERAMDDAMTAVQVALDPAGMARAVADSFATAAAAADSDPLRSRLLELAAAFQEAGS